MSEISDWIQGNWFALGSLLVQCAILATLFWYGRKVLGTLQASLNQAEVPQQPSPSNAPDMQPKIQEAGPVFGAGITGHSSGGLADAGHNLIGWLQEPMGDVRAWRRVMRWLQAPMGS